MFEQIQSQWFDGGGNRRSGWRARRHGAQSRLEQRGPDHGSGRDVSATSAGLASLKLHISQIELREDVTFNGTAATPSNCIALYQGQVDQKPFDDSNVAGELT
jgi:hypothetical protein